MIELLILFFYKEGVIFSKEGIAAGILVHIFYGQKSVRKWLNDILQAIQRLIEIIEHRSQIIGLTQIVVFIRFLYCST